VSRVEALISDFGGVLTTPLVESFAALQGDSDVDLQAVGMAMARVAEEQGINPLFELETGRMTEHDFLGSLGRALSQNLGREIELHGFGERYFANLHPNEELIAYFRSLRERGLRLALLTNNVREWEPLWRPKLPVDELFELVVDSAFVGMRKPDPEIYRLTLDRLGGVPPQRSLFVDDNEGNVDAARDLGMHAVHFRSNEQAIPELRSALGLAP
jgi:putative hydrolase of the HAD superfamily